MPDRLTDEELRLYTRVSDEDTSLHKMAAELLTRRAESAPFAVGEDTREQFAEEVQKRKWSVPLTAKGFESCAIGAFNAVFGPPAPAVPTKLTAAELFAEEFIEANVITVATTTAAKEAFAATLKRLARGEASDFPVTSDGEVGA